LTVLAVAAAALLSAACSHPRVHIGFTEEAKPQLAALPGKIGLEITRPEGRVHLLLDRGTLKTVENLPSAVSGGRSHPSTSPGAAWRGRTVREGAFMSLTLYFQKGAWL
jgi:hypothetical protein